LSAFGGALIWTVPGTRGEGFTRLTWRPLPPVAVGGLKVEESPPARQWRWGRGGSHDFLKCFFFEDADVAAGLTSPREFATNLHRTARLLHIKKHFFSGNANKILVPILFVTRFLPRCRFYLSLVFYPAISRPRPLELGVVGELDSGRAVIGASLSR
jgi:hypothetical protein